MRNAIVTSSRNFNYLVFSTMHWHNIAHELLAFYFHQHGTTAARIEPVIFGSAAELPKKDGGGIMAFMTPTIFPLHILPASLPVLPGCISVSFHQYHTLNSRPPPDSWCYTCEDISCFILIPQCKVKYQALGTIRPFRIWTSQKLPQKLWELIFIWSLPIIGMVAK